MGHLIKGIYAIKVKYLMFNLCYFYSDSFGIRAVIRLRLEHFYMFSLDLTFVCRTRIRVEHKANM